MFLYPSFRLFFEWPSVLLRRIGAPGFGAANTIRDRPLDSFAHRCTETNGGALAVTTTLACISSCTRYEKRNLSMTHFSGSLYKNDMAGQAFLRRPGKNNLLMAFPGQGGPGTYDPGAAYFYYSGQPNNKALKFDGFNVQDPVTGQPMVEVVLKQAGT